MQRDLKRARIVLLAAAGRSTRSIAKSMPAQVGKLAIDHLVTENVAVDVHRRAALNATINVVPAQAPDLPQIIGRDAPIIGLASLINTSRLFDRLITSHVTA